MRTCARSTPAWRVADEHDVQVAVHTDGLNEGLSVDDTLAVSDGRVFHAYHVEGCGGGHTPDVLRLAGVPHVLASSTNPTLPFGRDAVAEHFAMIMSVHALKPDLPGDAEIVRARVRAATMAAENVLHDRGVIPITSSDAQGMGRAGETVRRTFQLAVGAQAGRRRGAARQRAGAALSGEAHDQPRARARPRARGGVAAAGPAGRHRAVVPGGLRGQAPPRAQVGAPGLGNGRRPQLGGRRRRATADRRPVRGHRGSGRRPRGAVHQRGGRRRGFRRLPDPAAAGRGARVPRRRPRADGPAPRVVPRWSWIRAGRAYDSTASRSRWTRSTRCRSRACTSSRDWWRAG